MKIPKLKEIVEGKNLSKEEAADLRSQIEKDSEFKKKVCEAMNQFDEPISFTVHQKTGNWTMRNIAFWKAIYEQKDSALTEHIMEVLGEKS